MQAEVNGTVMHYRIEGPDGAPVVACSHCLAGSMEIWEPQVAAFRSTYRLLLIDTRGHGKSSAPEDDYSMDQLASDAVSLLDLLGIERVHFMGISMGGMIAQTLALLHPARLSSLVLCDTTSIVPGEMRPVWEERIDTARKQGMAGLADGTIERWFSPGFQEKHPETVRRIRRIILDTPVSGFAGCSRAISNFNVKAQLHQITLPTLILVGENDPGTPVQTAREIHESIRHSEMAVLPGAFHLSNIETADEFNRNLAAFLAKH